MEIGTLIAMNYKSIVAFSGIGLGEGTGERGIQVAIGKATSRFIRLFNISHYLILNMPAKKSKKTPPQDEVQEQLDPQQEAFEKLSDKLTATFAQGFDKLQQAIVDMAGKVATQAIDSQQQKRPAEPESSGYNT